VRRPPLLCVLALLACLQVAGSAPFAWALENTRSSGDPSAVLVERAQSSQEPLAAIDALAGLTSREATQALVRLLHAGLPDASVDRILERLVEKPRSAALDGLEPMTRHRRAGARVLALRAVAAVGAADAKLDASTSKLLAFALRDSDPRVRGTAAGALGQRFERLEQGKGKRGAGQVNAQLVEVLLRAVARGVPEAARAAGLAAPEASLPGLHEALRGLPLTATLDAYDAVLARGSISEAAKLDVLARLGEIATPATKAFLTGLIAARRFPANSAVQRALIETEKRIAAPPAKPVGAP
jgi:hypothetical protein